MPFLASVGLALVAGACLAAMRWHHRQWAARRSDTSLSDRDRRYFSRQYQRRMQASGMLAGAAVGLLVGYHWIDPKQWPVLAVLWITGVMVLAVWVFLLAGADWIATRHFLHTRRSRVEPSAPPTRGAASGNGKPVARNE